MSYYRSKYVMSFAVAVVLFNSGMAMAEERAGDDGLVEFKPEKGNFSVRLPGKPEYEVVEVGTAKEKQHQFKVGTDRGAYIVSYQDNPNLKGSTPKQIAAALESGRDRLKEVFQGKLLESKAVTLDETASAGSGDPRTAGGDARTTVSGKDGKGNKKHPGLNFRLTIPQANGEARCRFYMVGTRLYQIMAIGVPEFANSKEAGLVVESFRVVK